MHIVHAVIDKRLTYLTADKLSLLVNTIDDLNSSGVPGNLVEFGLALGGSAICIASRLVSGRSFYGFDNFDVIPSPEPIDGEKPNRRFEVIKSGQSRGIGSDPYYGYVKDRLSVVKRNFEEFHIAVDGKRVVLVAGLFQDTLPEHLDFRVAFAHIDCDWYAPVKLCLEMVHPLLSDGGKLIIDDYNHWDGCTKATDEFCQSRPDMHFTAGSTYAILTKCRK